MSEITRAKERTDLLMPGPEVCGEGSTTIRRSRFLAEILKTSFGSRGAPTGGYGGSIRRRGVDPNEFSWGRRWSIPLGSWRDHRDLPSAVGLEGHGQLSSGRR